MSGRLIFYDTSNYIDFPVGGQLTSIKNFLRFLKEAYPEHCKEILLVGVSTDINDVGKFFKINIDGGIFEFLAVTQATADLGNVRKSLRLQYVKGIWKYRKLINLKKADCNYIHTPEAFGIVRVIRPGAVCYVFSHGTYLNMWQRVRFFKKVPAIRKAFQAFLMHVIKKSKAVFVLEKETLEDYRVYNPHVVHVGNSIVCHPYVERSLHEDCLRFLYAGRLSAVKNVGPVIEAVKSYHCNCRLTILGDGEEREKLEELAAGSDRICFAGAVSPGEVQETIKISDILVMNSSFEGIPMIILEAISHGLPVITTNVGGIKEVLSYGYDSEVTDGSIRQIWEAMDKICADYNQYAKNAYEKSLQFDYRKVNGKIFDVLNESLRWERSRNDSE
ncbi:MAG: glycosyltransferase family 4 protein [Suilimivivens sp.]